MFHSVDKILIMGRSGCGKSYLGRQIQTVWPRRVIIDSLSEYNDHKDRFNSFKGITERLKRAKDNNDREFVFVFQFDPEREDSDEIFNQLIRVLYYFGNIQIVIEEVQNFSTPNYLPHWLKNTLLTGRHNGISLLMTSQRPGFVNKAIVSQCTHIFCGNLKDKNDINYVSSFLNEDAIKLANLKNREFIFNSENGNKKISTDK